MWWFSWFFVANGFWFMLGLLFFGFFGWFRFVFGLLKSWLGFIISIPHIFLFWFLFLTFFLNNLNFPGGSLASFLPLALNFLSLSFLLGQRHSYITKNLIIILKNIANDLAMSNMIVIFLNSDSFDKFHLAIEIIILFFLDLPVCLFKMG